MLQCVAVFRSVLRSLAVCCIVLLCDKYIVVHCTVLQRVVLCCSMLQCVAACFSMLYVAVCCRVSLRCAV